MPVLSQLHQLFHADTCHAYIHTLRDRLQLCDGILPPSQTATLEIQKRNLFILAFPLSVFIR
jgi:hypothetical protein